MEIQTLDAVQIENEIKSLADSMVSAKWKVGRLLNMADEIKAWKQLGHDTKNAWLISILPAEVSRSLAYKSARQLKEHAGLSEEDLREIPDVNLEKIRLLPERQRMTPEVIEAAKSMPETNFVQFLNENYSLHVETVSKRTFKFTSSEAEDVDRALENYMQSEGAPTKEQALWELTADWR